jgi:hypothetical protein
MLIRHHFLCTEMVKVTLVYRLSCSITCLFQTLQNERKIWPKLYLVYTKISARCLFLTLQNKM